MSGAVPRLLVIDWARGIALVAMALFHFGIDMELVGIWPPRTTTTAPWIWSARTIAGSFVFLAGLSLWLAHGTGIRWRAFGRRLALLVAAAAAVSAATYVAVPNGWVRFGILHSIALSSVIGLAFLRLPWPLTLLCAAALLWWGPSLAGPQFNGAAWLWLGLGTEIPFMMDYEPLVPWLAPCLLGIAVGRLGTALGLWARLAAWPATPGRWAEILAWPGQHALMVYLVHQPLMLGGIMGVLWIGRLL